MFPVSLLCLHIKAFCWQQNNRACCFSRVELKRLCEIFTRMFADPHSKVRRQHVSHVLLLKVKADVRKQQFTLSVEREGTVRAGGINMGVCCDSEAGT